MSIKPFIRLKYFPIVFLTILLLYSCVENKNDNSDFSNHSKKIDSINMFDSIQKPDLNGNWKLQTPNSYNLLSMYENNTWKMIFKDYKNDTLIKKGKYTVAKDSAVFFRYFGSLHWPNSDTINDYKTSLGAFVLFLNKKGELKDNQEDYDQTYIKVN